MQHGQATTGSTIVEGIWWSVDFRIRHDSGGTDLYPRQSPTCTGYDLQNGTILPETFPKAAGDAGVSSQTHLITVDRRARILTGMPLIIRNMCWRFRPLGRGAEFCPVCRAFRVFKVTEISRVNLVLLVPVESDHPPVWLITCDDCHLRMIVDPWHFEPTGEHVPTVDDAIQKTNPKLPERLATRMELEQRVLRRRATREERTTLLQEPFALMEGMRATHALVNYKRFLMMLVGVLAIVIPGILLIDKYSHQYDLDPGLVNVIGLTGILVSFALWRGLSLRWKLRRDIHRLLGRALDALRPTREELTKIIGEIRRSNLSLGRMINIRKLDAVVANESGLALSGGGVGKSGG